ncbi:helix-turn-helix transcriptional regulator [Criibacterium bergeronii]|uniref:helix-turn-helix transcriptional regulator n=1 Tax=Criibacterium bergeronii TaxID=1871336 RepID=UPI00163D4868|nr:helix-turn-helix transcriptional regulator [Criibacterium bergeronii]
MRSKVGLTQKQISKLLNVSTRSYIFWEKGKSLPRDLRVYLKLTKIFSIPLSYLLQSICEDKGIENAIKDNDTINKYLNYISELSIIFRDENIPFEDILLLDENCKFKLNKFLLSR